MRRATMSGESWARVINRFSRSRGRRRQDEHRHQVVAHPLLELLRALPVDVEQHVVTAMQGCVDRRPRRAVVVIEDAGMFQKFVSLDHAAEARRVDELVIDPVLLARSLGARRAGDAELDV